MKYNVVLCSIVLCLLTTGCLAQPAPTSTPVTGSGASFPYQIYSLWFMLSNRDNTDIQIDYVAKGSGGGIKDFQQHKVDFAASDAAMNDTEIAEVKEGVQLLPMTAGEVVLAYKLKGIKNLKLPRDVYPQIFLGKIRKWNHPAIVQANPGVELPDMDITVVTRSDSSGTTFVFTKHLSAISDEFKNGPGFGKKVTWPENVNMKRFALNLGISGAIQQTSGSIGYIDYGFALLAQHDMASLQNREGKFIDPGLEGGQAALANAAIPANMIVWLSDPAGEKSYPITTYTWMMFYKKYDDPKKAAALRRMITYCLDEGQKISDRFGYIPLPENVIETVRTASENIL
jgi:phosphate transport system substrate-binding protein